MTEINREKFHRLEYDPQREDRSAEVEFQQRRAFVTLLERAQRYLRGEEMHDGDGILIEGEENRRQHYETAMSHIEDFKSNNFVRGQLIQVLYREHVQDKFHQNDTMYVVDIVFNEHNEHLELVGPTDGTGATKYLSLEGLSQDFDLKFV